MSYKKTKQVQISYSVNFISNTETQKIKKYQKKPINFKLSRKGLKKMRIRCEKIEYQLYLCFSELAMNPILVFVIRIVLVIIIGNSYSLANCVYDSVVQVVNPELSLHLYQIPLVDCSTSGIPYATNGFRLGDENDVVGTSRVTLLPKDTAMSQTW